MRTLIYTLLLSFTVIYSEVQSQTIKIITAEAIEGKSFDPANVLWYTKPAAAWEDALPVGNGRLGAMVFGGVKEERIQLNEETYWTGGPYSTVVQGGYKALPEIQKLIFEGKPIEAHKLFGRKLMGYPVEQQKYQSLANLHLFYENKDEAKNYKRWLDLGSGVSGVQYEMDGVKFTREVFASAVDQTIAIRLTASEKGQINFETELICTSQYIYTSSDYMEESINFIMQNFICMY